MFECIIDDSSFDWFIYEHPYSLDVWYMRTKCSMLGTFLFLAINHKDSTDTDADADADVLSTSFDE